MNAFHPDFIKTYYPDLLKEQIISSKGKKSMEEVMRKKRLENADYGKVQRIPKATPVSLKPLEFMIYSRAGAPK
jgi:hypothetical protein